MTQALVTPTINAVRGFSQKRAAMFLQFLAETGRVKMAAQLCGLPDAAIFYQQRKIDQTFSDQWAEALSQAGDNFEEEAVRRAVNGVRKDVYYKGEIVGEERVYSDGLLGKLLDGAKREKYNPVRTDSTKIDVHVGLAVIPMTAPTMEDWERAALEHQQSMPQAQIIDTTAVDVPKVIPAPRTTIRA